MNEFAAYLARRGHEVEIVCSKPGRGATARREGYDTLYYRSLWTPAMARLGVHDFHVFPLTTAAHLLRARYDVVHCFNFLDSLAAAALARRSGAKTVLHLTSIPPAVRYRKSVSAGGRLLRAAIQTADEVLVVGAEQQAYFERRFRRRLIHIPAPVDTTVFSLCQTRDVTQPVILCASALDDRRKGGRFLMRAFNGIKRQHPGARLQITSQASAAFQEELLGLVEPGYRRSIEFLGVGRVTDLPGLFGRAAVVVVPSLWEAFSMVVLESLSCGTPVVATSTPEGHEVITDVIGRTFVPGDFDGAEPANVDGFVEAVDGALDLSARPETALHCRKAAEQYAWTRLGPRYESLYYRITREQTEVTEASRDAYSKESAQDTDRRAGPIRFRAPEHVEADGGTRLGGNCRSGGADRSFPQGYQ